MEKHPHRTKDTAHIVTNAERLSSMSFADQQELMASGRLFPSTCDRNQHTTALEGLLLAMAGRFDKACASEETLRVEINPLKKAASKEVRFNAHETTARRQYIERVNRTDRIVGEMDELRKLIEIQLRATDACGMQDLSAQFGTQLQELEARIANQPQKASKKAMERLARIRDAILALCRQLKTRLAEASTLAQHCENELEALSVSLAGGKLPSPART